jgi:hypothetical protein
MMKPILEEEDALAEDAKGHVEGLEKGRSEGYWMGTNRGTTNSRIMNPYLCL